MSIQGLGINIDNSGEIFIAFGTERERIASHVQLGSLVQKGEIPFKITKGSLLGTFLFETAGDMFPLQVAFSLTNSLTRQVPAVNSIIVIVKTDDETTGTYNVSVEFQIASEAVEAMRSVSIPLYDWSNNG